MAKSDRLQGYRSDHTWRSFARGDRSDNLLFGIVTSILLHSVLFLGSDYWLRAFAPKQELAEPIPIEYVEVPPNETKTPPETSRRASIDSVAGGKAKLEQPVSAPKSASPTAPKASTGSEPSEVFLPERTQQKAGSPNLSPQKLQPKPPKIAIAPTTKPSEPQRRQTVVTPATTPPEPEPSPTASYPTSIPLALKLRRQPAVPPTTPPEPEPSPTASYPTTKPLAFKLRQRAVAPTTPPKPPEPEPSPTASYPTTKPLAFKLQQRAVAPTTPPEPPLQTAVVPTPKPPEPQPSPTAVPTSIPLALKPRQTTAPPTTKPPALKPRQTTVPPTTKPPAPLTRQENRGRLAAKYSPEQLENRTTSQSSQGARRLSPSPSQGQPTTSRKRSQGQPSPKTGGASSLGGPISLSNRNFGGNNLAALPNSNPLNRSVDGIDARQDADLGPYLEQLQQKVKQQWIPGLTESSRRTVIHFTVSRAGLVSNLRIAQTSGFSATDEAAVSAVKRAVPFSPLPTTYTENYINIQFTFNINVYGELELWRGGQ